MRLSRCHIGVGFFIITLSAALAHGQTGPDLLIKPWDAGQHVDTTTDFLMQPSEHTRENAGSVQISTFSSYGRYRVFDDDATPRFGYDFRDYQIRTDSPLIPKNLIHGSIGFAQPVGVVNDWFVALTGAVGYAGNSPFSDPEAVFAIGNVIVGHKFNVDRALVVALNYNGNRAFFPDVPLPGFGYADRATENLTYVIGLPYNTITYEPFKGFQIEGGWNLITSFSAKIAYQFTKHFAVYGQYSDRIDPYHIDNTSNTSRIFFQTHNIEVGFRGNLNKLNRLSIGGGWAFGQEFAEGWDTRTLNPILHLRDGPYARIQLEIGF